MDRNFDDLAERFQRRVYGGLKGQIRLEVLRRDLDQLIAGEQRLKILDIGAGLGQLAIELAGEGHEVHYNDLSQKMLEYARDQARSRGLVDSMAWHPGRYQQLTEGKFDLVLCHALLEWVDDPQGVIHFCARVLRRGGALSLSFYNPAGKTYRNLIRGNFDWLDTGDAYQSDAGSLTPNRPCSAETVDKWLKQQGFQTVKASGIRVFHDYVVEKRGGHTDTRAVLDKELEFSGLEPFKWLGRYLHYTARLY